MEDGHALPVFRGVTTRCEVLGLIENHDFPGKAVQYLLAALPPVCASENNDEVIPADVTQKVDVSIDMLAKQAGSRLYDCIALAIAVQIVERLEIIKIDVAYGKSNVAFKQDIDMLVDGYAARQLR